MYLSFYLDRLIEIDEQRYRFSLNCMLYLSWKDERAGAAVEEATTAASAPGGSCGRTCNGQRVFVPGVSRCCDPPLWLPSIVFRNVEEFPQGRAQPYYIDVDPDAGTVTWRVEMRSSFLTTLDVSAFPFDTQSLDMVATLFNFPGQVSARCGGGGGGGGGGRGGGAVRGGIGGLPPILFSPFFFPFLFFPLKKGVVRVIPSATALGIYTFGAGDDLSGWHAADAFIFVRTPVNYSSLFSSAMITKRQASASAPGDPVPLAPSNSPAAMAARGGKPAPPRFGEDIGVVDITITVAVHRLWLYFSLSAILPIVVCTAISFLAFWVHPADLSTRLSLVVGLFLALVAVQFVLDGELPKASYGERREGRERDMRDGREEGGERVTPASTHTLSHPLFFRSSPSQSSPPAAWSSPPTSPSPPSPWKPSSSPTSWTGRVCGPTSGASPGPWPGGRS